MTIRIGDWTFDHTEYDAEGDVLYLSIGEPRPGIGEETPEGHVMMFDVETGEFCGLTLISIGDSIARRGEDLTITVPQAQRIDADDLKPALSGV
jgi:uncharacterized protein YuzE